MTSHCLFDANPACRRMHLGHCVQTHRILSRASCCEAVSFQFDILSQMCSPRRSSKYVSTVAVLHLRQSVQPKSQSVPQTNPVLPGPAHPRACQEVPHLLFPPVASVSDIELARHQARCRHRIPSSSHKTTINNPSLQRSRSRLALLPMERWKTDSPKTGSSFRNALPFSL